MQFTESSAIGLRSAFYELVSPDYDLRFVLLPMIHIAQPSFYQTAVERLQGSDNLIFEGVSSNKTWFLVQSYQLVTKRKDLGLVLQSDHMDLKDLPINKIHGDVSSESFDDGWNGIPFYFRILILLASPLYGAYLYLTATPESLAKGHSVEDSPGFDDVLDDEEFDSFREALVDKRDKHLVRVIEDHIENYGNSEQTTAIVYGAGHMPAVFFSLSRDFGYRVENAEWVQVI